MNPGAETIQVTLHRNDTNEPWGFRLNGGIDFTTPLSISQVNPGGVGDRCGLKAGDAVLSINNKPSDELEHEAAKYEIIRSGNQVNMLIQRAAVSIWKPKVTALSDLKPHELNQVPYGEDGQPYVQKTSLAYTQPEPLRIGSAHNRSAKPFPGFGGAPSAPAPAPPAQYGAPGGGGGYGVPPPPQQSYGAPHQQSYGGDNQPALGHSQYNTPIQMYSGQNIADSYNAHAQGLSSELSGQTSLPQSGGAPGYGGQFGGQPQQPQDQTDGPATTTATTAQLNTPPKNTQNNTTKTFKPSPTLLAVHEELQSKNVKRTGFEKETRPGEEVKYEGYSNPSKQSRSFRLLESNLSEDEVNAVTGGAGPVAGIRSVRAPVAKPPGERKPEAQHATCQVCGSLCVGVFVKVKGQPMHPECYKCQRCGINLKQKGKEIMNRENQRANSMSSYTANYSRTPLARTLACKDTMPFPDICTQNLPYSNVIHGHHAMHGSQTPNLNQLTDKDP